MKTISLTIAVILLIIGAIYWHDKRVDNLYTTSSSTPTQVQTGAGIKGGTGGDYTPTDETASTDVSTWKTYTAPLGLATLKYPSDWTLSGMTLTSPKKDMTITASYKKGTLAVCAGTCTKVDINGITYNRTASTTDTGTTITYSTAKNGYVITAEAKIPTNPQTTANIALADQIVGTVNVK